ncbi:carbamoyltransferase N-terminal domain-containing protein [Streptomyces sp. NPDC015184]|uniref:carbamoyltransferase N-terminal domain-containing protein n=1 Tax=Streptomyces sp. NPDC015184 TaxID=3364946 RepID=UPI0036F7556F
MERCDEALLICGIKATHDGGVAVIDGNRLLFSIEVEKLGNGHRYSHLGDLARVAEILAAEGLDIRDIDQFVMDGWWQDGEADHALVRTRRHGRPVTLPVAPYQDRPGTWDPLRRYTFTDHDFTSGSPGYASYHHVSNHLFGSYCTSPFAAHGQDALALMWDGAMVPRLYHVDATGRKATLVTELLPFTGNSFADFSAQFDPFRPAAEAQTEEESTRHHLSVAGKAMAYAALGRVEKSAYPVFDEIIAAFPTTSPDNAELFGKKAAANRDELLPGLSDADLIATFQAYLGDLLLHRLSTVLRREPASRGCSAGTVRSASCVRPNLVIGGGCALNIKWNSMLRASGLFDDIWIAPFPNDSGAAVGTAVCEMIRMSGRAALEWGVYSGPRITVGKLPQGWQEHPCDEGQLAQLLHSEGEPVVVLSGRAELGPRALGNRSILAPATDPAMKDRLNRLKGRAGYRPVAPVCLTPHAPKVFTPGTRDPYMLFEHRLRPGWADSLPAVIHLDGTARLQTIDPSQDTATARILSAYEKLSGIPVLCNTSANHNGRGFFPDVASAAEWGGTRYIWSGGKLYTRTTEP